MRVERVGRGWEGEVKGQEVEKVDLGYKEEERARQGL